MVEVVVSKEIEKLLTLDKQITFATAKALTLTAKQAQESVINAVKNTFTTRGNWYLPSNKFGIRISAARKDNLEASVHTAADWLEAHETGGTKTPRGKSLAVPTDNVRRTKRQIITRAQRPKNLRRSFVVQTRSGPVLFQRKNKRTIVALYNLEPKAKIKRASTVYEPTLKVVSRRFDQLFARALDDALETSVKRDSPELTDVIGRAAQ
ncbi:MAG: hypothetical protein QOG00_258 [Pyrinomonadaceae bacterium]|nr:hypothetical protein [Pyrinomonadaceae bacterium]